MQPEKVNKGDILKASNINAIIDALPKPDSDPVSFSENKTDKRWFIGVIVANGPAGEAEPTNHQYWVNIQFCTATGAGSAPYLYPYSSDDPRNKTVLVTNLGEQDPTNPSSGKHTLQHGQYMFFSYIPDTSSPFNRKYITMMPYGLIACGTVTDIPECSNEISVQPKSGDVIKVHLLYPLENHVPKKNFEIGAQICYMQIDNSTYVALNPDVGNPMLREDGTKLINSIDEINILNRHDTDKQIPRYDFGNRTGGLSVGDYLFASENCNDKTQIGLEWTGLDLAGDSSYGGGSYSGARLILFKIPANSDCDRNVKFFIDSGTKNTAQVTATAPVEILNCSGSSSGKVTRIQFGNGFVVSVTPGSNTGGVCTPATANINLKTKTIYVVTGVTFDSATCILSTTTTPIVVPDLTCP